MATEDPTAERWLPIEGYEGLYEVSDFGRVRTASGKILCLEPTKKGYFRARLHRQGKVTRLRIHRLVLLLFDRPPGAGEESNHKDLNKSNNRLSNLEWLSHDGNMAHFTASGRTPRGERSGKAKATTQSVIDMRNRASTGETLASIARHYGMSEPGVAAIVRRRVWRHVP